MDLTEGEVMTESNEAVAGSEKDLRAIAGVYADLLQVSSDFLRQAQDIAKISEDDVVSFRERRALLLKELRPLVERQQKWLAQSERATLAEPIVKGVDAQLEQMRQLEEINMQLMERISLCRSDLVQMLGEVRMGKKVLSGYGRAPKQPSRFCRGTV